MWPIVVHLYISQRRLIHHLLFQISFAPISFPSTYHNIVGQEGTRSSKTKLGSYLTRRAIYSGGRRGVDIPVREYFAPLGVKRSSPEWSV